MPRPKPTIETYADLKKALSKVFYKVEEGKIDAKIGTAAGYVGQILAGVLAAEKDSSGPKAPTAIDIFVRNMSADREAAGLPKDDIGGTHPLPREPAPQATPTEGAAAK